MRPVERLDPPSADTHGGERQAQFGDTTVIIATHLRQMAANADTAAGRLISPQNQSLAMELISRKMIFD
jgi:hypothetical protein